MKKRTRWLVLALSLGLFLTSNFAFIASADDAAPPILEVEMIPPLAGVRVSLDEQLFVSDADGIARLPMARWDNLQTRLQVLDSDISEDVRARPDKVIGDLSQPNARRLRVLLNVFYRVTISFVDLENKPVPPTLVDLVRLKNSLGQVWELEPGESKWVQGSRVVPLLGKFESKDIYYTVEQVMVEGTNAVNQSQQKFFPRQTRAWQTQLMYYPARFTARDLLFGFPIGNAVRVKFPSGRIEFFDLDGKGEATVPALPRGSYMVNVEGVFGYAPVTPLAMSRKQEVVLKVISVLDMIVVAAAVMAVAVGLLIVNRPRLRALLPRLLPTQKAIDGAS